MLIIDGFCFACGEKNLSGLKLKIEPREERVGSHSRKIAVSEFIFSKEFQGYGGVVHGGILSTVLDELMIYALFYENMPTVTAKMEVVFRKKAFVEELLKGKAWILKVRDKMAEAEAEIMDSKNEIIASGKGLFAKVDDILKQS